MTYTIIGCCPRTGRLGVGIATYSLAVGSYCPSVKAGVGALSTQANVNPGLGPLAIRLLELGHSPTRVLEELHADDGQIAYRQIGIVDRNGVAVAHTGEFTRTWAGHKLGDGYVSMGNVLAGEPVVEAIAAAFEAAEERELDERLLVALEAGRDAGGQQNAAGEHLTERSAGLIVHARQTYAELDLRVDVHDDAVTELRRIHGVYAPYRPYYHARHVTPEKIPAQDVFVREQLGQG